MEQFFFGPDSEVQAMRECIRHQKECMYYLRSKDTPICAQCKAEVEKKQGNHQGTNNSYDRQTLATMNISIDEKSGKSSSKNNFTNRLGQQPLNNPDKEKVMRIEEYTETFLETVNKKYEEMLQVHKENLAEIQLKDKFFKIESQLMMTRIQKFISFMLVDAQREMHKNLDFHQKRIKKQINDYDTMFREGKYWEVIYDKKEIKSLKRKMTVYMQEYKKPRQNIQKFAKLELLKNLSVYMQDFMEVLDFTITELENDIFNPDADPQQQNDFDIGQATKDFDFMLDSPSVKNLKKVLSQKRFLLDKNELLPRIRETVKELQYHFRKEDNANQHLSEYNSRLNQNSNQEVNKEFVRIEKEDYVFFGQVDKDNKKHGIGTSLFDNGFCYQGMYENDQMTGIGISLDPNLIKYMGEHKTGQRNGHGILYLPDGRMYEGTWLSNRMHGKGHEKLPNGQKYLVYTNNGKRMDLITVEKEKNQGYKNISSQNNQKLYDQLE